jgi:hypothetical protein
VFLVTSVFLKKTKIMSPSWTDVGPMLELVFWPITSLRDHTARRYEEYIKELRHLTDHFMSEKGQMEKENNALLDVVEPERFAYAAACATHQ